MAAPIQAFSKVLCAGTIPNADFVTRVKAAAHAGFNAISLFPVQYLNALSREKLKTNDMRSILRDHNVSIITVDPLLDWFAPEASAEELLVYKVAELLESPFINVAPAFAPHMEQQQVVEALRRVCDRSATRGLKVEVEILPWSLIPNYPALFEIVRQCQRNNLYVTLDCLHFFRSGGTLSQLQALGPDVLQRVSNIQLCDITGTPEPLDIWGKVRATEVMLASGVSGARTLGFKRMFALMNKAYTGRKDARSLMTEALCSRLLPGDGDIDVKGLVQLFERSGCSPALGVETWSLAMNRLPAHDAARLAMDAVLNVTRN